MPAPTRFLTIALAAVSLVVGGIFPAVASADPVLDIELTRDDADFPIVYRSDRRVDYTVTVANTASTNASLGEEVTCDALGGGSWTQSPTFTFKWIRDGDLANPMATSSGGTTSTYTVQNADQGHSIQCAVEGANAGGATALFSPPLPVEPVSSPAPPTISPDTTASAPTARPAVTTANGGSTATGIRVCVPPNAWVGPTFGSGDRNAARFTGNLLRGSPNLITDVVVIGGRLEVGLTTASSFPAGTRIVSIDGDTLTMSAATTVSFNTPTFPVVAFATSNQIRNVTSSTFAIGQTVTGLGIPTGTTVTAIDGQTLTLSADLVSSGGFNVALTEPGVSSFPIVGTSAGAGTTVAGSNVITALTTAAGTGTTTSGSTAITALNMRVGRWVIGLPITGPGIPAGTTVTATSGTGLTLSQPATASGTGVSLSSEGALPFAVGQRIEGPGIPNGTTITAVGPNTLTLSAAATASASDVYLSGTSGGNWSFQWLRNGNPIPGATSSMYAPQVTLGTANTTSGSNQLTSAITARGTGTLASGSTTVTGLATTTGRFIAGQTITGTGIPAATTISSVGPGTTLELSAPATASGSQSLSAGAQPFAVGQSVRGTGIPTGAGAGTTTAGSDTITALTTAAGAFVVGQEVTGAGIPNGTTITTVGAGTLTLSANATASATGVYLAGKTTITAIAGQTVTISTNATANGTAVALNVGPDGATNLQCQAIGRTGDGGVTNGGTAIGSSDNQVVPTPSPTLPNRSGSLLSNLPTARVLANFTTSDDVTVEVELPAGLGTYADRIVEPSDAVNPSPPSGWTCSAQPASGVSPAKALCTRNDLLAPGASYPQIVVRTALGVDAPDHAIATATVSGGGASAADSASLGFDFAPAKLFGIEDFRSFVLDATRAPHTQAGAHPFLGGVAFGLNTYRRLSGAGGQKRRASKLNLLDNLRTPIVDTPRGFVGNALAIGGLCPSMEQVSADTCPSESAVGGFNALYLGPVGGDKLFGHVIYAVEPEFGRPAQFAFYEPGSKGTYVFFPTLRPEDGYAMSFESAPIQTYPPIGGVDIDICSFGAKLNSKGAFESCKRIDEPDPDGAGSLTGANPKPLITNPTKCTGDPPKVTFRADSWQNPGVFASAESIDPMPTDCHLIRFEPEMSLEPTSERADSPTGMDVEIYMPTEGLESKTGISQSTMKRVTVTFPEGMAPNPTFAHGLGACSAAQVGINPDTGVPNNDEARCPDSSKIGSVEIDTPIINGTFTGDVFLARQGADNPFDSNLAMYMVFSQEKFGITVKVAGEVKPDPVTGQLTVVFDDNPEWPFSSVRLNFAQGPRSPLLNPPMCGTYDIRAEITPWAAVDPDNPTPAETVEQISTYEVTEGPNGGPCPPNNLEPKFNAGTTNPTAGATSPFVMRLQRDDGTQRFTGLTLSPPQGLTAYLKGIPYCSDSTLAAISPASHTGQAQFDSPSCPAASQIGTTAAGAGAGDNPFYVNTGRVYLAGPYKGAPLSVAAVVPVLAGPFDLGSIVTRVALNVNPKTAEIKAVSDPIPAIWQGILVDVRDLRVNINRPGFMLNPTSCAEKSIGATITGAGNDIASTGDDSTANVSNRFQVGECAALEFKPRMTLTLRGGTKRGKHPALTATLEPGAGNANIANISVALPRSEFLENAHIRTVCTRPDFAADNCPAGAIYGRATVYTPLLDEPLTGPVYLRSSDNLLPDLVPDLRGPETQPIKIESSGRTDSINGGIRNTFDFVPDAPFTRFVLRMQGGRKGLLVNSRDICRRAYRATVNAGAHNGRTIVLKPKLQAPCGKKAKKSSKAKRAKRGR